MSTLDEAKNNAPKKTFQDVYEGLATIVAISPVDARFTDGLSDQEKAMAMDLEVEVQPDDPKIGKQTIVMRYTAKKMVNKRTNEETTEAQDTLKQLKQQKLLDGDDICSCLGEAKKGTKVTINCYKEISVKGEYVRCRFSMKAPRLSQAEVMKRLAMMSGKAPAAAPHAPATPAPAQEVNPFA